MSSISNFEKILRTLDDLIAADNSPTLLRIKMRSPSITGYTYRDIPLDQFDRLVPGRTIHGKHFDVFAFFDSSGINMRQESVKINNIIDMELI